MDSFPLICRGCLIEGGDMKNMYEWGLGEDFYIFSGLTMSYTEEKPMLLCEECEQLLLGCVKFRTRCQRSDFILRNRKNIEQSKELLIPSITQQSREIDIRHVLTDNKLTITISTLDMESKIYIPCPFRCKYDAIKQKDLHSHLVKNHEIGERNFEIDVRYHCLVDKCSYNKDLGKKFFTGRKFLNQHINKVHKVKDKICDDCYMKFSTESEYQRHLKVCNVTYVCAICNITYKTNERLLVHLKRKHPDLHKIHKLQRRTAKTNLKCTSETITEEPKRHKKRTSETITSEPKRHKKDFVDYNICDSPKRSFATQTFIPESNIRNDVALPSWAGRNDRTEDLDRNFSTIETQTVFEDLLSLKSQNSEEDSIFFSENVSLSDIQTQTFPIEFGLSRKECITSETQTRIQSPDLSIKETQTCFCLFDSPKVNFKLCDSVNSSPSSINLTSTETQTAE